MSDINQTENDTLARRMCSLSPKEAIEIGLDLCAALEQRFGNEGSHGALWPGNIRFSEGKAVLGAEQTLDPKKNADILEYIAPEAFWSGEVTPASDVYSVGLILYTALNEGEMPFFDGREHSAEIRAEALQSRMHGVNMPHPRKAGRQLGSVILKAVSYHKEDRYSSPKALREALLSLPEDAAIPAAVPVMPLTPSEMENSRSYKVDKAFEAPVSQKQKKKKHNRSNKTESIVRELSAQDAKAASSETKTEEVLRMLTAGAAQTGADEKKAKQKPGGAKQSGGSASGRKPGAQGGKKKNRTLLPLLGIAAIVVIVVIVLATRNSGGQSNATLPVTTESETPAIGTPRLTPTIPPEETDAPAPSVSPETATPVPETPVPETPEPTAETGPDYSAMSQAAGQQERIGLIRQWYAEAEAVRTPGSADGPVKRYYIGGELAKVEVDIPDPADAAGATGQKRYYYFKNGVPYFCYFEGYGQDKSQLRLYFWRGELIRWIETDHVTHDSTNAAYLHHYLEAQQYYRSAMATE